MEENTLKFVNLANALDRFVKDFTDTYKSLLRRDGKKATGNLIKSVTPLQISFGTGKYEGSVSLADYWKYVEYGRKKGGKFPPYAKILEWVRVKPVLPRPVNGLKPPTEKQLAFLICRKIARDGIEPGNQFDEALNLVWARQEANISSAITDDLQEAVNLITV